MVIKQCGDAAWDALSEKVGLEWNDFSAMESYPDSLTYELVGAAAEMLDTPAEDILKAFGRHWVLYTARSGYGEMMDTWGDNLVEFLDSLNSLHARLRLAMPQLQPPSFEVTDVDTREKTLTLKYFSDRPALAPMVVGLLEGLGERFETPVEAEQVKEKTETGGYDEFFVRWAEETADVALPC